MTKLKMSSATAHKLLETTTPFYQPPKKIEVKLKETQIVKT